MVAVKVWGTKCYPTGISWNLRTPMGGTAAALPYWAFAALPHPLRSLGGGVGVRCSKLPHIYVDARNSNDITRCVAAKARLPSSAILKARESLQAVAGLLRLLQCAWPPLGWQSHSRRWKVIRGQRCVLREKVYTFWSLSPSTVSLATQTEVPPCRIPCGLCTPLAKRSDKCAQPPLLFLRTYGPLLAITSCLVCRTLHHAPCTIHHSPF